MNRSSRALTLLLALLVMIAHPRIATAAGDTTIVIGDAEVLRIRADAGGRTAAQRAAAMRQRIVDIYQAIAKSNTALKPDEVTLDLAPGAPSVRVRGMLLLTVTPEDAKLNGNSTMEELARIWHVRLRDAMVKAAPLPETLEYPSPGANPDSP